MKRRAFLHLLPATFAVTIPGCSRGLLKKTQIRLPERGISAHRGASDTHPENTLAAFSEAINVGAHLIEFDIHLTKDREMVILHDETVNRTTNGTGDVSELTLAEIKKLDAGFWKSAVFKGERIPTFREALAVMPLNTWIVLDVKGDEELVKKVVEMVVEEDRLHQSLFLPGNPYFIMAARAVNPNVLFNIATPRDDMKKYINLAIELKADFANITLPRPVTPEFIAYMEKLHKNGTRIQHSIVNSLEELRRLYAAGIDFYLTDELHMMMKVVEELGIKPLKPIIR